LKGFRKEKSPTNPTESALGNVWVIN